MKTITATVETTASPSEVWETLTDGAGHSSWDPHIESIGGDFTEGSRLTVKFRRGMTFKPTVTELRPASTLEWLGRTLIPGLFDGRHRWQLESTATGTRITQSEQFTGVLVPFMGRVLTKTEHDFELSTAALSKAADGS